MEPDWLSMEKFSQRLINRLPLNTGALCYQAFNLARYRVDMYKPGNGLPPAIITDVDETVLDNSPYAVNRARIGMDYEPVSWFEWTDRSSAKRSAGAGDFLRYASSRA